MLQQDRPTVVTGSQLRATTVVVMKGGQGSRTRLVLRTACHSCCGEGIVERRYTTILGSQHGTSVTLTACVSCGGTGWLRGLTPLD